MAKHPVKRPTARAHRPPRPPTPALRAWHVVTANGGDTTVTAHDCEAYSGVLAFTNHVDDGPDDYTTVLVRAFSPSAWQDVELVDVSPTAPPPDGPSST